MFSCIVFLICFVLTVAVLILALTILSYRARRNNPIKSPASVDLEKNTEPYPGKICNPDSTSTKERCEIRITLPPSNHVRPEDMFCKPYSTKEKGKGKELPPSVVIVRNQGSSTDWGEV